MLNLSSETGIDWFLGVKDGLPELLVDHAHCEKKAASSALSLIFRYPEQTSLLAPLSELAREELQHFELLLRTLAKRGIPFGKQKPSPYAGRLMEVLRHHEPQRLLDILLCCALIEARSCERMQVLADHLEDAELASLYRSLLASEARHHRSYLSLAEGIFDREEVKVRLTEIADHEAEVIATAPNWARLHC